jgi:hypothetical protein
MKTIGLLLITHGFLLLLLMNVMGTKQSRKGLHEAAHLMTKNIP